MSYVITRAMRSLGLVAAASLVVAVAPASAEPITALTTTNGLFTFDSATPGTISAVKPVTGLDAGDSLVAIDRNPFDGALYGIGRQPATGATRMYRIGATGAAVTVGPIFSTPLESGDADMDFDPQNSTGLARIVSGGNLNLRWSASSGTVNADTPLDYPVGDVRAAVNPIAVGLAYSNNVPSAATTTAYIYDYANPDVLATLGPLDQGYLAGNGQLGTVGVSGVLAGSSANLGLDAGPTGTLFALLRTTAGGTRLYTLNPATGGSTVIGTVGDGLNTTRDIATDAVTNTFTLSAPFYNAGESDGKLTVTVNRSQSAGFASVHLKTADASATAAALADYKAIDQTVFFAAGELAKTIDIDIRADAVPEPAETFTLTLASPMNGNATLGTPSTAVGQIQDNDATPVPSTTLTALTTTNSLVTFSTAAPATVSSALAITGLAAAEQLVGLDRRPSNGRLYAISSQSRLYLLDESSGAATPIGAQFAPPLTGTSWGFDFSPVADLARTVAHGGAGQNLRINPDTGNVIIDGPMVFAAGDPFQAQAGNASALAYTNNVPGASSTTPYGYNYTKDIMFRLGSEGGSPVSPNTGTVYTVGTKSITAGTPGNLGLDVGTDGTAWALIRDSNVTRLHVANLSTGIPELVGTIGDGGDVLRDIAAPPVSNTIQLSAGAFAGSEAAKSATVTVTRDQALGRATVNYATANGSAAASADYTATAGTLTFAAGETSQNLTIPVTDDTTGEGTETFTLTLSSPAGGRAGLGPATTATVTLADNDTNVQSSSKPTLRFCGKATQNLTKQKSVLVCLRSNRSGTAAVRGKLKIGKRSYTLKEVKRGIGANTNITVKLKLSKATLAAVKAARGKVTAAVTITVRDQSGQSATLAKTITRSR